MQELADFVLCESMNLTPDTLDSMAHEDVLTWSVILSRRAHYQGVA